MRDPDCLGYVPSLAWLPSAFFSPGPCKVLVPCPRTTTNHDRRPTLVFSSTVAQHLAKVYYQRHLSQRAIVSPENLCLRGNVLVSLKRRGPV
jgi:hypothetical protein